MNEVKNVRSYGTTSLDIISFVCDTERVNHFKQITYFVY